MTTIGELARQHTDLSKEQIGHLVNLASEWGMLADVCFADLLMYVPVEGDNWLVLAQVRAATGQTLYLADWVGSQTSSIERPLLGEAMKSGVPCEGEIFIQGVVEDCRMMAIPVQFEGEVIAVLTREWSQHTGRQPGELERTYLEIFDRFAEMIVRGAFPFVGRVADASVAPRVGDGAIVLDADARVRYSSPNATSALHRVGISANAVGQTLSELGVIDSSVRQAFERREPVVEEFEQTSEVTLLTRCIPIVDEVDGEPVVTGAVMLLRDVSELRRRDRLLLSKDATIREIHHRVKNNLQTVSALLRLQSRRIEDPAASAALNEAVRRIASIALVHETLSSSSEASVAFDDVLDRLVAHALELSPRMGQLQIARDGALGSLDPRIATPLSLVVTELIHNALEHGLATSGENLRIEVKRTGDTATIVIFDDGIGLPTGFSLSESANLGLQIVRTLTENELKGSINLIRTDRGTEAQLKFPL
jgi:two-component sensor histidine kinase